MVAHPDLCRVWYWLKTPPSLLERSYAGQSSCFVFSWNPI